MDPKELAKRVYKARVASGLSQVELAEKVGMAQTGIAAIELGKSTRPRKLNEIAKVLNVPLSYFLGSGEVQYVPVGESGRAIAVKEQCGAGVWVQEGQQLNSTLSISADARYPFEDQFALLVAGNSANKIAPDGAIALCVETSEALPARDGDFVVCRRYRGEEGDRLVEISLRRYKREGDDKRPVLYLESTDPAFQTPLAMDGSIVISGVVLSVHNRLR